MVLKLLKQIVNTNTFNAGRSSGDRKVVIEVASTAPSSDYVINKYDSW